MVTLTTGPCLRFESFEPSGAISSGRCANFGSWTPQRLEDQDVLERVGQVFLAAQDVGDAEIGIVGAGGHVIGRHAGGAQQGEVLDIGGGLGTASINQVVHDDFGAGFAGDAIAQDERFASRGAAVAFLF